MRGALSRKIVGGASSFGGASSAASAPGAGAPAGTIARASSSVSHFIGCSLGGAARNDTGGGGQMARAAKIAERKARARRARRARKREIKKERGVRHPAFSSDLSLFRSLCSPRSCPFTLPLYSRHATPRPAAGQHPE